MHDNFSAAKRHKDCYKIRIVLPPNFNTPHYGIKELPTIDKKQERLRLEKSIMEKNGSGLVKSQRKVGMGDYSYHGRPWDVQVRKYCETLRSVDESIGSVLDYLKEEVDDNTLVIYMGDNGFACGNMD